jgi:hypothetical protein
MRIALSATASASRPPMANESDPTQGVPIARISRVLPKSITLMKCDWPLDLN